MTGGGIRPDEATARPPATGPVVSLGRSLLRLARLVLAAIRKETRVEKRSPVGSGVQLSSVAFRRQVATPSVGIGGRRIGTRDPSTAAVHALGLRLYRHYFWIDDPGPGVPHVDCDGRRVTLRPVHGACRDTAPAQGPAARDHRPGDAFDGCWLLMDSDQRAGDNAEHLARFLQSTGDAGLVRFVLSRESPDWPRLEGQGFRLIDYMSDDHRRAMAAARYLISSHADDSVVAPFGASAPRPSFVFLQHGVIQSDLSRWLNAKPIDVFLTTSPLEHRSIVAPDGPYKFSDADTFLIGMPRFDRLLDPGARRRNVVIAPTWRRAFVTGAGMPGMKKRRTGDFAASDYLRDWRSLLHDDRLKAAADRHGGEVVFAPHPNMTLYLNEFEVPGHVAVFDRHSDGGYTDLARSSAALVTDYSSVAFDFAFAGSDVVYFQSDADDFFARGRHVGTKGYFDYQRDGFGPVERTVDGVLDALTALPSDARRPVYAARRAEAFPFRDGRNCHRLWSLLRRGS